MFSIDKVYFSATLVLVVLSSFAEVTCTGVTIPIRKGMQLRDANGAVDLQKLERSVRHSVRFAYHLPFPYIESPLIVGLRV